MSVVAVLFLTPMWGYSGITAALLSLILRGVFLWKFSSPVKEDYCSINSRGS